MKCKECLHYGICTYSTIIDKEIKCQDFINNEALEKWVRDNYKQYSTGWTWTRSEGNYTDCFYDGVECGTSWAAYEVGCILGMELEEPDEPKEDEC